MKFDVSGKVAAVTGAGGGIGRSLCRSLARAGVRSILALDRDVAGARATAELCAPHCAVHAVQCDVSRMSSLSTALLASPEPIGIFCANAGVATAGGCDAPDREWQASWDVNVMQVVFQSRTYFAT